MARPTDYTPELLAKAKEYLATIERLPTIEGLSLHLGVSRETLYAWEKEKPEFSDILENVRASQAETLIQNGLDGKYNPTITKLMLSKHGYRESQSTDITSGGEPITPVLVKFIDGPRNRDTE